MWNKGPSNPDESYKACAEIGEGYICFISISYLFDISKRIFQSGWNLPVLRWDWQGSWGRVRQRGGCGEGSLSQTKRTSWKDVSDDHDCANPSHTECMEWSFDKDLSDSIWGSPISEDILSSNQDRGKVLIERNVCHLNKVGLLWFDRSVYSNPYLEDGDRVVADHVGAGEGLGEEEEHKESHWKKDSPAWWPMELVKRRV